jgi:exopolyphosphatase/guanosine-5'-triphosphate,3'-diphosphate pyrophosphatase
MVTVSRARADAEPRGIEIETDRVLRRHEEHVGVIDVGSNSIRLVVYDDSSRAPFPRFNEKSMVALANGLDDEDRFTERAMSDALHTVRRFASIARAMDVGRVDVLATEATRRAKNGTELLDGVRAATGLHTRLLSGEEEARLAALGVVSGIFQPKGLVGDIGGGSLEVAEVVVDDVGERVASMPLGALGVKALLDDGIDGAKAHVDTVLATSLPPLLTDPVLYAVGGGWRALARVHIALREHPIKVVHGYAVPAEEARDHAKRIARMSTDQVASLPDVPDRRVDTLPAAALVMWRVLKRLKPERVVFSSSGLREGWLYSQLGPEERARDPLLEGAQAIGLPLARVPAFSAALAHWTDELFPGEAPRDRRLRLTVCALTDMCWRDHVKVRAGEAFHRLLQFPFIGITHPERAFVAVAIMSRYGGKVDDAVRSSIDGLLSSSELRRAEILGRVLLLGHRFSASVPEILEHARLRIDADAVRLEVTSPDGLPDSEAVQTRLRQLAKATGVETAEIVRTAWSDPDHAERPTL